MNNGWRCGAILLSLTLFLASSGCSGVSAGLRPDPPSEDLRSGLGRVGVRWRDSGEGIQGSTPAKGSCDGAGRGALAGLLVDLKITGAFVAASGVFGPGAPFAMAGFLAAGLALTPVFALFGSLYGLSAAPDAAAVGEAAETLRRALDARKFSRGVAEGIVDRARVAIDDPLVLLPPELPVDGIDTILEVAPPLLILHGPYNVNPTLQLTLLQTATLTRVADDRTLYRITLVHQTVETAGFLDWAKNDAAMLQSALSGLDRRLGDRLIDEMFLLHALPTDREWKKVQP